MNPNMLPGGMYPGGEGGPQQQYGGMPGPDPSMGMGQMGGGMGMGMGMGGGMGMGMGMERIFPSVKLRGLPFDVTEDDIRMFLGCDPIDILMVRREGRLSGEAFIVLASPMHVELALSKNRTYLGRRYIEVYRSKKMDYYKAIVADMMDGGGMQHGGGRHGGYGMDPSMGMYGQDPSGGYGGMQQGHGAGYGQDQAAGAGGTTILKLRGLPFSVQDEDIVRWFDDASLGITPLTSDSVFIVHEHGRPSGIAFVEFPTAQEATGAMAKNKQMMGSRYIEIFPASRADLEKYRARSNY
mmetsp:Transcript_11447/g.24603  ORF Transcript_11447/g.24603 Transcript_11447/m.24603 type:complete len:296 (+) Transcript_11447:172-1059(+)